ncbi:unnamed protein product [Phytophthora fragariaefolia]|uniref:Unnamed protein product n=1 Tax=Phytophthora fragariaefolia TaxID=1490495 RepID=A0A9W6YDW4_9STRA|nr:unnamed protein product [Phytophthora fragariaefolia]
MSLNALCKLVKNRYRDAFDYYNTIRKVLSKQNKDEKLNNELTPEEEKKYISYKEVIEVPKKVQKITVKKYGKLFLDKESYSNLKKSDKPVYLRILFDFITLWLNVHYPLRLVWPSILLKSVEGANYLEGNNLHLNDFKNVRLMGPQYDYTTKTSGGFSQIISRLFVKYNEKPMNMNVMRHIVESHIIQSPSYARLTNKEKADLHAKLLHSSYAANISYSKIANRNNAPEVEDDGPTFE